MNTPANPATVNPANLSSPVLEALEMERIATESVIAALKAHLTDREFERALSVALAVATKVAPPAYSFTVAKAVRRIAGESR